MKKILLLTAVFFFAQIAYVLAYMPIPAYKVPVGHHQNFVEKPGGKKGDHDPKAKRDMHVQSSVTSGKPTLAIIWVYSLDGQDILGPFYLLSGQSIDVPIDARDWGVYVQSDDHVIISVWVSYGDGSTYNQLPNENQSFQNALLPAGVLKDYYNC